MGCQEGNGSVCVPVDLVFLGWLAALDRRDLNTI